VSEGERLQRLHQIRRNHYSVITLVVTESATREPKTAKPPTMGPAAMTALTNSMVTTRMFCGDDDNARVVRTVYDVN
jgi:hypothetical protein